MFSVSYRRCLYYPHGVDILTEWMRTEKIDYISNIKTMTSTKSKGSIPSVTKGHLGQSDLRVNRFVLCILSSYEIK